MCLSHSFGKGVASIFFRRLSRNQFHIKFNLIVSVERSISQKKRYGLGKSSGICILLVPVNCPLLPVSGLEPLGYFSHNTLIHPPPDLYDIYKLGRLTKACLGPPNCWCTENYRINRWISWQLNRAAGYMATLTGWIRNPKRIFREIYGRGFHKPRQLFTS